MSIFDHLIVGGGVAGFAAARAIREHDAKASIAMITSERAGPYQRPALSKALWAGESERSIFYDTAELGLTLLKGRRVMRIDPSEHAVVDAAGAVHGYGKLLITTGARPRNLPFGEGIVRYLRSLQDYRAIRKDADDGKSFLVVGGGFLGAELAAALANQGNDVAMVFPEPGINARIFPSDLAAYLNAYYAERGVAVYPGSIVRAVERDDAGIVRTSLGDGRVLRTHEVVAAIGAEPETGLAEAAGLRIADGIVVDEYFRTSAPDVFAAGDVANYPDPVLGRRRVEHEDHATHSGHHAGLAMVGQGEPYHHLPLFYSDMFDHGYEAVGILDPSKKTFTRWEEPFRKGVTYYLDEDGHVQGVLLWNTWKRVDDARALVRRGGGATLDARPTMERAPAA